MALSITGCKADHLGAVSRIHNDDALMVVAARLPSRLEADTNGPVPRYLASSCRLYALARPPVRSRRRRRGDAPVLRQF